ncbi:PXA domain-containing protein [Bisporella sp. PMI_857]|nr:PXA domain-containing protein [Bisporella sp. PMI_857]
MSGTDGDSNQSGGDDLAIAKDTTDIPTPSATSSKSDSNIDDLTSKILRFLSTASPETIGGIAVGLAATTYLVLGRLGLVLIGALGGIVLHAAWEGSVSNSTSIDDARKEKSIDIVKRLLDLRDVKEQDEELEADFVGNSFEGFRPETAAALDELVNAIIRDYVKWWYDPILPRELSFPAATKQTLTKFIWAVSNHLCRKRPADAFLDFLTNSSSIIIVFLNELSSAMSVVQGTNMTPAEAVHTYLAENPGSNLANVLDKRQQSKKFTIIAEDILQNFLDKPAFECDAARTFLREILAGVVLEMTLKSCSKPEWINGWIVYLLESGEPDISQAIDAGMGAANDASNIDAIDGNLGNMGVAKPSKSHIARQEEKRHKKRLSKAEEAMEEAMEEARRLSLMIAEEEKKKAESPVKPIGIPILPKAESPVTTNGMAVLPKAETFANLDGASHVDAVKHAPKATTTATEPKSSVGLSTPSWTNNDDATASNTTTQSPSPPASQPQSPKSVQTSTVTTSTSHAPFTNFDQILPQPNMPRRQTVSLTLHNANIIIFDDSTPMEKGKIRNKPNGDILVQIEPKSDQHPGWMIVRKYSDFETLHEVLRRIAQISGVTAFTEQHQELPKWKEHTKSSLRGELERYLRDACWFQPLAESEGMKRFLEKDQGQAAYAKEKTGFGWPTPSAFESMGKGMLDVLASAPKGVADGGKVIGTGISGVFSNIGNLGQKKQAPPLPTPVPQQQKPPTPVNGHNVTNSSSSNIGMHYAGRSSTSTLPRMDSNVSLSGSRRGRASEDSLRTTPIIHTQPSKIQPMERRPSCNPDESEREYSAASTRSSLSLGRRSTANSRDPSQAPPSRRGTPLASPLNGSMERFTLPPPPSDMPDDWYQVPEDGAASIRSEIAPRTSTSTAPSQGRPSLSIPRRPSEQANQITPRRLLRDNTPLTEPETRVAVELMFAVINELYTLSSAWNIRRTLLTAAKQFLLRPGNPSLSSIQSLIQESIIASNTSDAGIASHLRKLRENTLPTEEEQKSWPPEMSSEDKERLRIKARSLFISNAVPEALKGVMGQAASETAMGRIFDLVQEEEIARGLMFGLLLQGVRAITH